MKKIIAFAAAIVGLASFAASAQSYAAPSDNLLFAQAQAPQDAPAAKAKKSAKAKKKSDAKSKAAAKSKKTSAKKAAKKKSAAKKAAPPPS
jgi:hypothetical protein